MGKEVLELEDVKDAIEKLGDQVNASHDKVKELAEKAMADAKNGNTMAAQMKRDVDEALTKANEKTAELRADLHALEQRQAAIYSGGGGQRPKTIGEQVVESDGYKSLMGAKGGRGSMGLTINAAITSTTAGGLIQPLHETQPVSLPKRRFVIRDLLNVIPITTSSVDYPKMTARTNLAAPVAESAAKPYSDYVWANATAVVRTIAHLAKITRQAMDDAPRLVAEVDSEMRYGLGLVEEAQILSGSGTGQNLLGILPQATAYAAPFVLATPTSIDLLRMAMLQTALALYPADGIVLSQIDWARITLTKTTDGAYLFSNPQSTVTNMLWGLPVVDTPAMAADAFLVGNFAMGATLYDRMAVELLISTENVDDFEKNLATMRAEERIALAVKRPLSFVVGDFGLLP
jgi:HK97 family phage major capsid protein